MNLLSKGSLPGPRGVACYAAAGFLGAVLAIACGGGGGAVSSERHAMLAQIGSDVALPTYRELTAAALDLGAVAATFGASPDESTLEATRSAWRRARATWRQSKAFEFGPATRMRTFAKIDFSPVRPDRIEQQIAGDAELTPQYVGELGANVKGFLAIEYLLFDPDGGDAAVLASFSGGDGRRADYLVALAGNLASEVDALRLAWEPDGGGFASLLATAGRANEEFPTLKSAVDTVVNGMILVSRQLDLKLAKGLGVEAEPDPEAFETTRSGNEVEDLLDDIRGVENVYRGSLGGAGDRGVAGVVIGTAPEIDRSIELSIDLANGAVGALPPAFAEDLDANHDALATARLRSQRLNRSLEIDLVSALGATVVFNPGDGD